MKRLEATGFITRTRQAEDERSVVVGLTEAGRAVEERVAAVQDEVSAATGLTDAEIVALRASLQTLTANLRNPASR